MHKTSENKYYIIVASKDHVKIGEQEGFAQAGHGKKVNLAKLRKGDWVIYYSSKEKYEDKKPFQKFTAIGQVKDEQLYQAKVSDDFQPWRRNVDFYQSEEVPIRPLLDDLQLITNRKRWGYHLMSGFVAIQEKDFRLIAEQMLKETDVLSVQ